MSTGELIETTDNGIKIKEEDYGQLVFELSEHDKYIPAAPITINKSNKLIRKMGNVSSLLSEQALLLALYKARKRNKKQYEGTKLALAYDKIKERCGTDFSEGIIAIFTNTELREFMNIKSSQFYTEIKDLMDTSGPHEFTKDWYIFYTDPQGRTYKTDIIKATAYDKKTGKTIIKFNEELEQDIINLQKAGSYTILNSDILRLVSKDEATWNLYQLLKSEIQKLEYRNRKACRPDKKEYMTEFGLAQLKFLLGLNKVDLTSKKKEHKACAQYIDENNYEEAELVLPQEYKKYNDWRNFKRRVLTRANALINGWKGDSIYSESDKAYEDLCLSNHPTDIHFRSEPVASGIKGKITGIRFYLRWDDEHITADVVRSDNDDVVKVIPYEEVKEINIDDINPDQLLIEVVDEEKTAKMIDAERIPVPDSTNIDNVMEYIDELTNGVLKISQLRMIANAFSLDTQKIKNAYMNIDKSNEEHLLDAMLRQAAHNTPKSIMFEGFNDTENQRIKYEALKHKPSGLSISEEEYIQKYVNYYLDKIRATPEETKTSDFKRLMDCIRKDYDHMAENVDNPNPHRQKQKKSDHGYMERSYTQDEITALERKKLGLPPV